MTDDVVGPGHVSDGAGGGAGGGPDNELLRSVIAVEHDVFTVRQAGREVAAALGVEGQDQVRIATALSEVGRQLLATYGPVDVLFRLATGAAPMLEIQVRAGRRVEEAGVASVPDLGPAQRLMDRWSVRPSREELAVTMAKRLPLAVARMTPADLERVRQDLSRLTPSTPLQELAVQNKNLLSTLEEIAAHRDELLRLNAELEETNRGVMALYGQLSDELEATNRGVVALYAELDEKSAQLRDASEAKSRFLANVSHELRAPATAIVGLLRLLLDPRSEPVTGEQRHQLTLVNGSAQDLLSLVNELLDLAKAESGRIDPQWSNVDLSELFDTLRGTMNPLVTKPDVVLVVEDPTSAPTLTTDGLLLAQILRNLLTNAIKFTNSGEVRLAAHHRPGDDAIDLVVSDTGSGIPAEETERVFEEFYQLNTAAHATVKGTGLGLPYARRLATLLGGSLTVSSTLGQGSAFTVTLPVHERSADGRQVDPPNLVLVVDDDATFRAAVAGVMRAAGARVVEAADGREALAAIAVQPPDVVLLDLRLPELDGTTVLDTLAGNEDLAGIPVVVLTAFTQDVAASSALPRAATVLGKADTALDALPDLVRSALRQSGRP